MVVISWPRPPWKSLAPINTDSTEKASSIEFADVKNKTDLDNFERGEELETSEEKVKGIELVISQPLEDDSDDDINLLPAECVKVTKITAEIQNECPNTPVSISGLTNGVIAKIPVILSRFTVQIFMDSIIILPESVSEIKTIHKKVNITQSLLAQDSNILFIMGFIRKNISYDAVGCWHSKKRVCGNIRHCNIDIPFKCTTPIFFNGVKPLPLYTNTIEEFEYLYRQEELGSDSPEKDKLLSGDFSEYNQISMEFFNERPYCELESSRIVEFNEFLYCTPPSKDLSTKRHFRKIEEKTVLDLTFKLLQKQQVAIPPAFNTIY